jgi:hypothetical protein
MYFIPIDKETVNIRQRKSPADAELNIEMG